MSCTSTVAVVVVGTSEAQSHASRNGEGRANVESREFRRAGQPQPRLYAKLSTLLFTVQVLATSRLPVIDDLCMRTTDCLSSK